MAQGLLDVLSNVIEADDSLLDEFGGGCRKILEAIDRLACHVKVGPGEEVHFSAENIALDVISIANNGTKAEAFSFQPVFSHFNVSCQLLCLCFLFSR